MKKQFVKIPMEFLKKKGVTPAAKLIIGYIFTRSNIEETEWLLNAADVTNNTGLSDGTAHNVFQDLIAQSMITFVHSEIQKNGQYPTKVYSINDSFAPKMNAFKSIKRPKKSAASRSKNETAAVQSLNGGRSKNEMVSVQGLKLEEYSTGKEEGKEYPVVKEEAKAKPVLEVASSPNDDWVKTVQEKMRLNLKMKAAEVMDYRTLPRTYATTAPTRDKLENN